MRGLRMASHLQRSRNMLLERGARCFAEARRRCSSGRNAETTKASERGGASLPSTRSRTAGALAVFGAMGLVGYSAVDDLLIYDQCSRKAMERASQDPRLKLVLGEEIQRRPWHWYEASLAVAHEGISASCSFPICGDQGTAKLHLKAVRLNGKSDQLLHRVVGGRDWEVLMLEAVVPSSSNEHPPKMQRINLMQTSDDLKTGDGIGKDAGQCISGSLQEV